MSGRPAARPSSSAVRTRSAVSENRGSSDSRACNCGGASLFGQDGRLIGGLGASGGTPEHDAALARTTAEGAQP
ncbi:heme-binding protein [Mycolicibacillus parakoreensis]|uniref:Heme-binding protein n=1 Tax=Mycolicibacillus parakoreensis TaxID=1069221 RepID=A0ABY3U2M4_9MYCO|nr:heme-binding protein [Mycolicibacillus parakoreensis]ULN51807.1 heme-binding protein [Mycolicibacillus parakoreensis]